jgi:uncharacterized protein (DUF488 family)
MLEKKFMLKIWTIGHSTRTIDQFCTLLNHWSIEVLIDVRKYAGSRRLPHFNSSELSSSLQSTGVKYIHLPELGGHRRPSASSHNLAWRNESFRGYADYMETSEFQSGIGKLLMEAREARLAYMCAELLWWKCHRALISDYLKSIGVEVTHIMDEKKIEIHPFTSAAAIVDGKLSYRGLLAGNEPDEE